MKSHDQCQKQTVSDDEYRLNDHVDDDDGKLVDTSNGKRG